MKSQIQEILRCPPGREQAILEQAQDLLDAGLAEMIQQMSSYTNLL